MKAFIVAALLVASVAGQSLDILKLNKEKSMLKFDRPFVNEMMLKKLGYPMEKTLIYGDNIDIPLYLHDEILDKKVLNLDELVSHPLFREYMTLPIFRQFWTYPMFQRYVSSVYFQRFMHIPQFRQYFINPVLFYKYVFPIVNLFKTDMVTSDITYTSVLDDLYKSDDMIVDKNVFPVVSDYEQDLYQDKMFVPTVFNKDFNLHQDNLYTKTLLEKLYHHLLINKPIVDDEILRKIVDPITGEIKTVDDEIIPVEYIKTIYGEKLVKNVLIKKLVQVNIITPEIYEAILLGKIDLVSVLLKKEIITPEVYELILTGKIDKFTVFRHILRQETLKTVVVEDLLKEVLLKKLLKFNIITPEVYQAVLYGKVDLVTLLFKKHIITPEVYQYVLLGKIDLFTVLRQVLGQELHKTTVFPRHIVKEVLLKKLIKNNIITPEIYEAVLLGKVDLVTILLKEHIITPEVYQYILIGKLDEFTLFRHILNLDTLKTVSVEDVLIEKMMLPYGRINKVNPFLHRMMVNKFDTLNKFDTIKFDNMNKFDTLDNVEKMNVFDIKKDLFNNMYLKKDLINDMYVKKDLFNDKYVLDKVFADKVNNVETVVPKMIEIPSPYMGVRTFDKKMIPEVIKA